MSFQLHKYRVPCVRFDRELGVVEAITGGRFLTSYFKTFSNEEVALEVFLVFVIETRQNFGFVPGDRAVVAVTSVLRNTRYVVV